MRPLFFALVLSLSLNASARPVGALTVPSRISAQDLVLVKVTTNESGVDKYYFSFQKDSPYQGLSCTFSPTKDVVEGQGLHAFVIPVQVLEILRMAQGQIPDPDGQGGSAGISYYHIAMDTDRNPMITEIDCKRAYRKNDPPGAITPEEINAYFQKRLVVELFRGAQR